MKSPSRSRSPHGPALIGGAIRLRLITALVGLIGFGIAASATLWQTRHNAEVAQRAFDATTQHVIDELQARLLRYDAGLRGLRGAVIAAGERSVRRSQVRDYIDSRDLDREFPGTRGFGVIWRVPEADEAAFVAVQRADGWPSYQVRQLAPHTGERRLIAFVEPVERNRPAIGLDIASEPNRNAGAIESMRTGSAALTAPITLVQASGQQQRSFLLMLPIYRKGTPHDTPQEREQATIGWTYAALMIDDVLSGLTGEDSQYSLALFDAPQAAGDASHQFYGGTPEVTGDDLPTSRVRMSVYGRDWEARLTSTPQFVAELNLTDPRYVGAGLFLVATLLQAVALLLANGRLRTQRERLETSRRAAIVEGSEDAIIGATLEGIITEWNAGAQRLFGYTQLEALGQSVEDLLLPADRQAEDKQLRTTIASGRRVPPFDTVRCHRDGTLISVSLTAGPILDAAGQCVGMAKTIRDMREAHRARAELAALNASLEQQVSERTEALETAMRDLRAILDAVPSMIGYWDRRLVNRVANRAYADWLGVDPSELRGRPIGDFLDGAAWESQRIHIEAALRGERQIFERSIPTADGSVRHVLVHYLPDLSGDETLGFYVLAHDITEITESRLKLAAAQRDNAALLQTLHHFAIVSVADRAGAVTEVNESFCRVSGYAQDELVGRTHRMLDSGEHDAQFWRAMWQQLERGEFWRGEICNRAKDGSLYWIDSIIAPFIDAKGRVEKYISISTDITPIKRLQQEAERARHAAEAANRFLQEVTDRLPLRIAYLDREHRYRFANAAQCEAYGMVRENLLGRQSPTFVDGTPPPALAGAFKAVLLGEAQRYETEDLLPDGSLADFEVRLVPDRLDDGRVVGYYSVGSDISVRKRAEIELRRTLTTLRAVLDAATQVAILTVDNEGRITLFNRGAEKLTGYSAQEAIGRDVVSTLHDPQEVSLRCATMAEQLGRPVGAHRVFVDASVLGESTEWTYRRKDGGTVPVSIAVTSIRDDAGQLVGHLGIAYDISARRQFEHSLREAMHRANHANRAKSQFLANMSHEIRTPMNAVIGLSYLLERTRLDEEQSGFVSKIKVAGKSLLAIINDVLDLSKIEASEMTLESVPFSLYALLREISELMVVQAEGKGIAFEIDRPDGLPGSLRGDSTRLRQVLVNLLSNAIKFTAKGSVRLAVQASVDEAQGRAHLQFAVRDTGIGIAPEALERLFQPFAQADTSTTRRYGGTGLGLSIVRQLVELMGGTVRVASVPNVGSEFVVSLTLPLGEAWSLPEVVNASTEGPALPGLRVLVVDDSALNLEVARRILELEGAVVTLADNGQEAVDRLIATPEAFDIVLMDVQMPVLDGHDATRRIRSALGLASLPVIALTAGVTVGEQERATAAGMNDVVGKPFDPQMLVGCIRRHVGEITRPADYTPPALPAPSSAEPWPALDGVDTADARRRLGNDLALFRTLLRRLLNDFADLGPTTALEPASLSTLARRMHNLKGSAGTLGAKPIERSAAQIELACGDRDLIRAGHLLPLLAGQLQALRRASEELLAEPADEPATTEDAAPLDAQAVSALLQQLDDSDLSALEGFTKLAPALRQRLGRDGYTELRGQMDNLQFAEVAGVLRGLVESADEGVVA